MTEKVATLIVTEGWRRQAACRDADPSIFLPGDAFDEDEPPYPSRAALAYCDRCPVEQDCLTHALASGEHGIWGGTSTYQRRQLRQPRGRSICPVCNSREMVVLNSTQYCLGCGATWEVRGHVAT